jgi:hypothetical protein
MQEKNHFFSKKFEIPDKRPFTAKKAHSRGKKHDSSLFYFSEISI